MEVELMGRRWWRRGWKESTWWSTSRSREEAALKFERKLGRVLQASEYEEALHSHEGLNNPIYTLLSNVADAQLTRLYVHNLMRYHCSTNFLISSTLSRSIIKILSVFLTIAK
ncbi:unnamed protein product [Fraxinus pennsylvanica]|uniref:Uncharacterized protein n=1 Tax=Fraxinus pennsylvanica TaxID=56036 RepID=A0AAD1ZLA8_9LAMI|nr:unnamed protein product [Fraxinus pennsylvanica]